MPGYCVNCGAPLTGAFCTNCGQKAQTSGAVLQPPSVPNAVVQPAPAPAPARTGRVLAVVGVIVVSLVAIGIAGTIYGVHWVKSRIIANLGGASGGGSARQVGAAGAACGLLSQKDLQQVLGVPIEKSEGIMDGSEPGCAYYTNPAAFSQLQQAAVEQARRDAEEANKQNPNEKIDNPLQLLKHTDQLEGVVKAFGLSQPDNGGRVFSFTVQSNFEPQNWSPLHATLSVIPGFEDVSGVGDRAMIGTFGHIFYVLKGNNMVTLDLTHVPEAKTRGTELGRRIVSRL